MKYCTGILVFLFGSTLFAADDKRPNIVLIFADDLGWSDVGYQGSDFYETPHLDRLAKEGMVFTRAYAAAANCQPSRACLMSGQYTPRHGVYAVGSTERGPKAAMRLKPIPNTNGLALDNVTIAEAMKAAGYTTGIFGKWHLNEKPGGSPDQQGFDVVFQSFPGWNKATGNNPKGIKTLTESAGEFMEKNKDKPFFLYLPHYAIHTAYQSFPDTLKKFQAKKPGKQHSAVNYAACLYDLDQGVGTLLKKINELGLEKNTIVVFTSDNGGTQRSSQEPLRGSKGGYYEGGIREPFIVRWPGVTKPGSKCDVPVISQDLYPTFLTAAQGKIPDGKVLDGENILPLLDGKGTLKRESIYWHFPGYLDGPVIRGRDVDVKAGFRTRPVTVISKGDWKLHFFHEEWALDGGREKLATNHAVELYNLKDDIGERKDLASSETKKRDELLDELLAWHKSSKALLATEVNPNYKPDAVFNGKKKQTLSDDNN